MQIRQLGGPWPVTAPIPGGGGIGQVWGASRRDGAVAMVRELRAIERACGSMS